MGFRAAVEIPFTIHYKMRVTFAARGGDILPTSLSPENPLETSLPFSAPKEGTVALWDGGRGRWRGPGWASRQARTCRYPDSNVS